MELDKQDILRSFVSMNSDFFEEIDEDDKMIFSYCKNNSEIWWNFALLKKSINSEDIKLIDNFFYSRNRSPTIYLSDEDTFENSINLILKEGYKLSSKDSWMFWEDEVPEINDKDIIEVQSEEDFEEWINTFIKSYPKDDPKNPYGDQSEFAEILKEKWKEGKIKKDKYFLAFKENFPVAVGILTNYDNKGYISGIGSIPCVRGKGFGKKISLYCVKKSFEQGNKIHFLATEKGDYPFEFYKRIGFTPKFTASYYTKNKLLFLQ